MIDLRMEPSLSSKEALLEMEGLLHQLSSGASPLRSAAVRYVQCRAALLGGELRPVVPGFLIQCMSISKFYEFIHLYHPDVEARRAFISDSLRACRTKLDGKRSYDGFVDSGF